MYLFSKKIKCLGCNGNYKGITERGKKKYVCSNYTNYRNCLRYTVEEDKLVYLVHKHIEIQLLRKGYGLPNKKTKNRVEVSIQDVQDYVQQINVDPKSGAIDIIYVDSTKTSLSDNRIAY